MQKEKRRTAIDLVKEKLADYPFISYTLNDDKISVKPSSQNGFEVSLIEDSKEIIVFYDNGWHNHFSADDVDNASDCFMFGLTNRCRVRTFRFGDKAYGWTLQVFENNRWVSCDGILIAFPFWRRFKIAYLQNSYICSL